MGVAPVFRHHSSNVIYTSRSASSPDSKSSGASSADHQSNYAAYVHQVSSSSSGNSSASASTSTSASAFASSAADFSSSGGGTRDEMAAAGRGNFNLFRPPPPPPPPPPPSQRQQQPTSSHRVGRRSSPGGRTTIAPDICNCCSAKLSSILNVIMKKTCPSCQRVVCPACLVFTFKIPRALCVCKRCDRLSSVNFEPRHLMRMRGKELHDILATLNIPYTDGSEKSELVELIVRHRGSGTHRGWKPSHPPEPIGRSLHDVSSIAAATAAADDPPVTSPLRERSNSVEVIFDSGAGSVGNNASAIVDVRTSQDQYDDVDDNDGRPREQQQEEEEENREPEAAGGPTDEIGAASMMGGGGGGGVAANGVVNLEDVDDEKAIRSLSIRELKSILLRNSVDYKGCCEKWELEGRVVELWRSARRIPADIEGVAEEDLCKICMNAPVDCVMLECGHVATCTSCGRKMNECPICRQFVVRVVHIFKA